MISKWSKMQLGEVADVCVSGVDKKTLPNEIPVRLCNYTDVYYNWAIREEKSQTFMLASAKQDEIAKFRLHAGQVAITKDSETREDIGHATFIANDFDDVILGYHCALITPHAGKLDGQYLNALFRMHYVSDYLSRNAGGSGQRYYLSESAIKSIPLFLPPINAQLRIAGVLGSIDEKIELNRKKIAELEALAKTIYDYWFVQFDFPDAKGRPYKSSDGKMVWNEQLKCEVPEGWETQPLGALLDEKVQPNIPTSVTVPYVTTENLKPNMSGYQREERSVSSIIGGHGFFKNDTLVSNIRPYFQKLWYADTNGIASSDVIRFHAKECPSLLFFALARADFFAYVMKGSKGSKMPRGDKAHIARYVLSWGNDSIRNKANALFQSILERCNLLVNESSHLEYQRDRLLPLLMNGQVGVE